MAEFSDVQGSSAELLKQLDHLYQDVKRVQKGEVDRVPEIMRHQEDHVRMISALGTEIIVETDFLPNVQNLLTRLSKRSGMALENLPEKGVMDEIQRACQQAMLQLPQSGSISLPKPPPHSDWETTIVPGRLEFPRPLIDLGFLDRHPHFQPMLRQLISHRQEKMELLRSEKSPRVDQVELLEKHLREMVANQNITPGDSTRADELLKEFPDLLNEGILFGISIAAQEDLPLEVEICLNKVVNSQLFLQNCEAFVNANKGFIVKQMAGQVVDENQIQASVSFLGKNGETHHEGQRTVLTEFRIEGRIVRAVIKPRTAYVDRKVVEVFEELNRRIDNTTSGYPLPVYQILQPEDGAGWNALDRLKHVSVWEYIPGKHARKVGQGEQSPVTVLLNLKDGTTRALRQLKDHESQEYLDLKARSKAIDRMLHSLGKMESIFLAMNITDQHAENWMLTDLVKVHKLLLPTGLCTIKPIDMEATNQSDTGMDWSQVAKYKDRYVKELDPRERSCIEELFKIEPEWQKRNIPVSTDSWTTSLRLLRKDTDRKLTTSVKLIKTFTKDFNNRIATDKQIADEIIKNYLINDIPYFVEENGTLYFGRPEGKMVIGTKT